MKKEKEKGKFWGVLRQDLKSNILICLSQLW